MTAHRLALIGAIAATLVLAGCSSPSTPDPVEPSPTDPVFTPVSLSELEYPNGLTDWLTPLDENKAAFLDWHAQFSADCDASLAGSADAPDCTEGMLTGLKAVNAMKTDFDFNVSDDDWASGEYTGLEALTATHDLVLKASASGSDFIDTCYYVTGGDGSGSCVGVAQTFLDDAAGVAGELGTWEL